MTHSNTEHTVARNWRERAACKGQPIELFFPTGSENAQGRRFCKTCPVATDCLTEALEFDDQGIRADTNRKQRLKLTGWRLRVCGWEPCSREFKVQIKPGQPPKFCCERCKSLADEVRKGLWDAARWPEKPIRVGSTKEAGHGRPSRYNAGCRCRACKAAARRSQRAARAKRQVA